MEIYLQLREQSYLSVSCVSNGVVETHHIGMKLRKYNFSFNTWDLIKSLAQNTVPVTKNICKN